MTDHYDTLGLARDASAADIKTAWRKLCAEHHPDKGGDPDRMAAINRAYEVLGDQVKRAEYDATGKCDGADQIENEARSNLAGMFTAVLDNGGDSPDIIGAAQAMLSNARVQLEQHLSAAERRVIRLAEQRNRVCTKKGAMNLFQGLVDQQLRDLEDQIARMKHGRKVFSRVGELLDDHEMEPQAESAMQQMVRLQQQGIDRMLFNWGQT